MAALSNYLENQIIDFILRGRALGITGATAGVGSGPTATYVALLVTNTNDANSTGVEVSGGSYARVQVPSTLAAWAGTQGATTTAASSGVSGATSNNAPITFPSPTANWGTVTGFLIYDALTGGNPLIYGTLTVPKTVNNADAAPEFPISSLVFTLDD